MARAALSRPVALALLDGLLPVGTTLFDYGCGRGGDVQRLSDLGYDVAGWDPAHYPSGECRSTDVVNLGYVVNVIENPAERMEALRHAWTLAKSMLIVSARTDWEIAQGTGRRYGDGFLTGKGTFQKFFSQEELRTWIDDVLGVRSIAAAPGIFYVFRDDIRAQGFWAARVRRRPSFSSRPRAGHRPTASVSLYEANRSILDPVIAFVEARGRAPEPAELAESVALRDQFGSVKAALALIRRITGDDTWQAARAAASDDLIVYLALAAFGGRPKFTGLPFDVQCDVKAFFGSYKEACVAADKVLFSAGDQAAIGRACQQSQVGKLTREALYVHMSALDRLSPLLRVYEGCGRALTGTVENSTLIKLNYVEPKVSYLIYPDFDRDPHPVLTMSVRADLQRLHVKVRDYHRHANPSILHRKETFVAPEYPARNKFMRLTVQEERYGLYADPVAIGTRDRWIALVASKGLRYMGHRLVRQNKER